MAATSSSSGRPRRVPAARRCRTARQRRRGRGTVACWRAGVAAGADSRVVERRRVVRRGGAGGTRAGKVGACPVASGSIAATLRTRVSSKLSSGCGSSARGSSRTSNGVTERFSSAWIRCRARAKACAEEYRDAGRLGHRRRQRQFQGLRHVGAAQLRHGQVGDPGDQLALGVVRARQHKRGPAGQQGVERGAERPDVHQDAVDLPVAELFRRGPRDGHARVLVLVPGEGAGDAEVGQRRPVVVRDQDVGGLDVAVRDPGPVGGLDGGGHLDADGQDLVHAEALAPVPDVQAGPGAVLHGQVGVAGVGDLRFEDGHDVGVRGQLRHQVRFGFEAAAGPLGLQVREQHLDGHLAARPVLFVEVDVGEPAGAEQADVA